MSLNLNYEPEVVVEDITELTEKEGDDTALLLAEAIRRSVEFLPGRQPGIYMRKK
ncbi:MAG: hypothetical protein ACLRMW_06440 [[Clostridium] symbiosum]